MQQLIDAGMRPRTAATLQRLGVTRLTAVQERALPSLLAGRDVVVQAPTGSGKTLAFLVPLVERLAGPRRGHPRALIVAPTRELVTQITSVLRRLDPGLRCAMVFGGVGYGPQVQLLRQGVDVVIGCPGRLLDLASRGIAHLDAVELLVLDEADHMLDVGFAPDVERIIGLLSARRQTALASATMPGWVRTTIARHLVDPEHVAVVDEQVPALRSALLEVRADEKLTTLSRLLSGHDGSALVFHRSKHGARKLARDLDRLGHASGALQGNLSQNARDRAVADFRAQRTTVLVATNVAARGLDVPHLSLVVNFDLPDTAEWLTHRVGRTARNGAEGRALTFLTESDRIAWQKLRRLGAPALPRVDASALLASGEWRELPTPAPVSTPAQATGHAARAVGSRQPVGSRHHRQRPRGGGRAAAPPANRPRASRRQPG